MQLKKDGKKKERGETEDLIIVQVISGKGCHLKMIGQIAKGYKKWGLILL